MTAQTVSSKVFTIGSQVVLAWLLDRGDFGLISKAYAATAFPALLDQAAFGNPGAVLLPGTCTASASNGASDPVAIFATGSLPGGEGMRRFHAYVWPRGRRQSDRVGNTLTYF